MSLHTFGRFLYRDYSNVDSVDHLTQRHVEAFLDYLRHEPSPVTGRTYSTTYQKKHVSHLVRMFEEMHALGHVGEGTLGIISRLDMSKSNFPLPRNLNTSELEQLDAQIDAWPQPEQRAALLVLRWTGARRDEVRRLTIDALGSYPDGQPKLRIPAGKTGREREVPLHPKAAAALQEVIDARKRVVMRGLYDDRAARTVNHLFVKRGRLSSHQLLIDYPLREICVTLGLVDDQGRPLVTSHRFRHTFGTQMAENGAQLQTIMSMLGNSTLYTALIYARMSDSSIREQYNKSILRDESTLGGPGLETLRQMTMSAADVDWLKTNYLKTSLELGHCLRLPQEGPCECDLYLSCSKFVTSSEYLPRLRDAAATQARLIDDAREHGWLREVERHQRRLSKIHQLISELEGSASSEPRSTPCALADEG
ncbi:site-specific integrase [Pseudarthrobacter phenanthrenivorans]|uniref:tyrosine-type recombinase/integrase n=1 Tax=Pseudarthrobacter phenanthrenivorans TaxID=361575 RepID=UPI00344C4015